MFNDSSILRLDVVTKVDLIEANGKALKIDDDRYIIIKSHYSNNDFVIIDVGDCNVTVRANDLIKAISNATNT